MTLLAIGVYLVGVALVGEGLSYLDLDVHGAMLMSIFMLTGVALAMVLMSETVRRKLLVLLHKNLYADKYDYRTQWLEFSKKVAEAESEEQLQDTVLRFYCNTFAVVSGLMFILSSDGERFECVANLGYPSPTFTLATNSEFTHHFGKSEWVLNVAEISDALRKSEEELLSWMDISFIVPLLSESQTLGMICLGPPINQQEIFYYEDFDLMKILARQATASLQNVRLSLQLSNLRELAAMGRVSTFVVHDLKNLGSNLALVAENAKEYLDDAEFQEDLHQTLATTVSKMTGLISRLDNLRGKQHLSRSSVDLLGLAEEAVSLVSMGKATVDGVSANAYVDHEEILKVFLNLIINGLEASRSDEVVRIEVGHNGMAYFSVTDSGCGMSEQFIRDRLFKPFETTKKKGFGIGLYQCKQIVQAHGGTISVKSEDGTGSKFTVNLPLSKPAAGPESA
jgi:putative PEP-CTERM system histidine kinase